MAPRLALARVDDATEVLRALARLLVPMIRDELARGRVEAEFVDVCATVPRSRRSVLRACRSGEIEGAIKSGRVWLARRDAVSAWLAASSSAPRVASGRGDEDLDDLRRAIGARRRA